MLSVSVRDNRFQRSIGDIVDEAVDRCVIWNSWEVFHNLDIPLDTGNQICAQWHVVLVSDVLPCLFAQTLLYALQALHRYCQRPVLSGKAIWAVQHTKQSAVQTCVASRLQFLQNNVAIIMHIQRH